MASSNPLSTIAFCTVTGCSDAAKLYDHLNRLGYGTFFDEATMERGADFQRELKWWLNDADLLCWLVLDFRTRPGAWRK